MNSDVKTMGHPTLLPEPTLQRLPWYLAYVAQLKDLGVERVSSTQISKNLNVDSSQIAKDLSFLNVRGKTRIGYAVDELESILRDFLGFQKRHPAVMIGVGSLGGALIQDSGLTNYGLNIVAGFDVDSSKIGTDGTVPVFHVDDMTEQIRAFDAEVAVIAVPVEHAEAVADAAVDAGIKALWNFTPHRLRPRQGVVIQDTSIYSNLALMYNRLEQLKYQSESAAEN